MALCATPVICAAPNFLWSLGAATIANPIGAALTAAGAAAYLGPDRLRAAWQESMGEKGSQLTRMILGSYERMLMESPLIQYEILQQLREYEHHFQQVRFGKDYAEEYFSEEITSPLSAFPKTGLSDSALEEELRALRHSFLSFAERACEGRFSGTSYTPPNGEAARLAAKAAAENLYQNPLHSDDFQSAVDDSAKLVAMCAEHHGYKPENVVGLVQPGGSASNLHAIETYCNHARSRGIEEPLILAAATAHDSILTKGKRYGKVVKISTNEDGTMNLDALKTALNKYGSRVAMIAASYPAFPHGCADDLRAINALALAKHVPLHVDSCLGGALAPDLLGKLSVYPGVTSFSYDVHKTVGGPKGASVIAYIKRPLAAKEANAGRMDKVNVFEQEWICYAFENNTNMAWTGGLYATPDSNGSRSVAAAEAARLIMLMRGQEGYKNIGKKIATLRREIQDIVKKTEGIEIVGDPRCNVVSIKASDESNNIYALADHLTKKGIPFQKMQPGPGCDFRAIHICLTEVHVLTAAEIQKLKKDIAFQRVELVIQEMQRLTQGTLEASSTAYTLSGEEENLQPLRLLLSTFGIPFSGTNNELTVTKEDLAQYRREMLTFLQRFPQAGKSQEIDFTPYLMDRVLDLTQGTEGLSIEDGGDQCTFTCSSQDVLERVQRLFETLDLPYELSQQKITLRQKHFDSLKESAIESLCTTLGSTPPLCTDSTPTVATRPRTFLNIFRIGFAESIAAWASDPNPAEGSDAEFYGTIQTMTCKHPAIALLAANLYQEIQLRSVPQKVKLLPKLGSGEEEIAPHRFDDWGSRYYLFVHDKSGPLQRGIGAISSYVQSVRGFFLGRSHAHDE